MKTEWIAHTLAEKLRISPKSFKQDRTMGLDQQDEIPEGHFYGPTHGCEKPVMDFQD